MIARFIPAALVFATLALTACEIQKAPASAPPPAPTEPAATAPPVATPMLKTCPPIGYWKASGPAGETEIKVETSGGKPGAYDVSYKGATLPAGAGHQDGNKFTVDTGQASGGMYSCNIADDCKTMNCGFTGQAPTVFTKTGG